MRHLILSLCIIVLCGVSVSCVQLSDGTYASPYDAGKNDGEIYEATIKVSDYFKNIPTAWNAVIKLLPKQYQTLNIAFATSGAQVPFTPLDDIFTLLQYVGWSLTFRGSWPDLGSIATVKFKNYKYGVPTSVDLSLKGVLLKWKTNFNTYLQWNRDVTKDFVQGMTQFAEYTEDEFRNLLQLGALETFFSNPANRDDANRQTTSPTSLLEIDTSDANTVQGCRTDWPTEKRDWKKLGFMGSVKDQGQVGSCWDFAGVGVVESTWAIALKTNAAGVVDYGGSKSIPDLSEQQVLDCCNGANAFAQCAGSGNNGGWPTSVYRFFQNQPICTESGYKYRAKNDYKACPTAKCAKASVVVNGYSQTQMGCEADIAWRLLKQPVVVTLDASKFSSYSSGTFSNCGTNVNHAVILVGFTDDYWIIKNSWGTSWGIEWGEPSRDWLQRIGDFFTGKSYGGYMKIKRGTDRSVGTCGIVKYGASYPTVNAGPTPVQHGQVRFSSMLHRLADKIAQMESNEQQSYQF